MSSPSVAALPHFKIEYRFDIGDVEQARKAAYGIWWRKRRMRVLAIDAIALIFIGIATYAADISGSFSFAVFVTVAAVLFPVTLLAGRRSYKNAYDALWKTYKPLRLLHATEIDGKGISYEAVIARALGLGGAQRVARNTGPVHDFRQCRQLYLDPQARLCWRT